MTLSVSVIDYGSGNLFSVRRALEYSGAKVALVDTPEQVLTSSLLILPGVGAFRDGMEGLQKRNLVGAIQEFVQQGRKLLGICLGMQMLLDSSEEFGKHAGLGLIPGKVSAIPERGPDGARHKIPHIGWNWLRESNSGGWKNSLLHNFDPSKSLYFVHSYNAVPENREHCLADADYCGLRISAAISRDNVTGFQFHPEKSGEAGLAILRNFLVI